MKNNSSSKLISIIVPLYNEAKNIPILYRDVVNIFENIPYQLEMLFVNDASTDESLPVIQELISQDSRVRVIDLARNFGKEAALTAGLHEAKGDAALMIDADLQHPPKYIPEFIKKWERGAEIVVGVRVGSAGENFIKRTTSKLFYKMINKISETEITPAATDFRLLDRIVVDEFVPLSERVRITRGLIDWLGFSRTHVEFEPAERRHGQAAYTMSKLVKLGLDSVLSMSLQPLRIAGYLGGLITFLAVVLGVFILVENYILNDPWNLQITGSAILAVIILFLVGIVLICLGLIALYIGKIHSEVTQRPLYVVRRKNRKNKKQD